MTQLQRITITPTQLTYPQIALTPEQQHYLGRVLRLRPGDRVIAMDGQGHWWLSELEAELKQAHILEAIAIHTELPISVTLLVAMPKGSGMDDIVRQATELGVTDIVPILSDRTLLNPSPQKLDRWRRIAQEAAEQAERQLVPTIATPMKFADALPPWQSNSIAYLCEARGTHPHLLSCLCKLDWPSERVSSVVLATGPEGGWTEDEVQLAIAAGFQPVSLGQRVLRAVTAPLCALAIVTSALEPMRQPGKKD